MPKIDATRRCFLDIEDFSRSKSCARFSTRAVDIKSRRRKGRPSAEKPLAGRMLAMIFDKPSTRTRVSFDVGMRELGGETLMLTGAEMQLGRGETIADTARVLSRFVDAIMIRILSHEHLMEMAAYATVPVINGLTKKTHPCQVMADLMTFEEHRGADQRRARRLGRRRLQCVDQLGSRGGEIRLHARHRLAGAIGAAQRIDRPRPRPGRRDQCPARSLRGGARTPIAC